MKNKVIKHTIVDGTQVLYIQWTAAMFLILFPWTFIISINIIKYSLFKPLFLALFLNSILCGVFFFYMVSYRLPKIDAKKKIAYGYRRSIKEALTTEYPEGMVYILQNVLQELDRFDLDFPPSRKSGNQRSPLKPPDRDIIDINQTDDDVRGFPNRTNLKEAIYMAQDLSQEWSGLNYTEKSDAMGKIRAKIQPEDIWLDWHKITLPEGEKVAYWFSYTEEDHRNNQSFSNPMPQTPTPKPNPPYNPSQVLSFNEWVNQNPALQHFSEQDQREAYQRYLKFMGVNIPSFDEWLNQNPALQYFSEQEQREAYQKYLDSL